MANDLDADYVRSILDYNRTTGIMRWRQRTDVPKNWNTKYAGKPAGSARPPYGKIFARVNDKAYAVHVLAWLWVTGEFCPNEIDHKNTTGSDNSWNNLRKATASQNSCNRNRRIDNSSGYKGVHFDKSKTDKPWKARIMILGKRISLGYFSKPEEAASAYAKAAEEFHGEFRRL